MNQAQITEFLGDVGREQAGVLGPTNQLAA
jgi:hypothetical protein